MLERSMLLDRAYNRTTLEPVGHPYYQAELQPAHVRNITNCRNNFKQFSCFIHTTSKVFEEHVSPSDLALT